LTELVDGVHLEVCFYLGSKSWSEGTADWGERGPAGKAGIRTEGRKQRKMEERLG
jgi:hypothetical protein